MKRIKDNLLYYSTNTYLAYIINETFYNGMHYVWCSPVFDSSTLEKYDVRKNIPPTSNPSKIYLALKSEVDEQDYHSAKISSNKKGIKAGASIMLKNGKITDQEFGVIVDMVDKSSIRDFRPLIYLIPKEIVGERLEQVPVDQRANPLSVEYRILDLYNNEFEIIEF